MKKETKIHEFDPAIYPVKLWVIKTPTKEFIDNNFVEFNGDNLNFEVSKNTVMNCYNQVVVNKNSQLLGILISIFTKPSYKYIAHESTHAARFIWNWLGEDNTGVEADAYLVGWIAECIEKVKFNKV
jgi:hypothetical protein